MEEIDKRIENLYNFLGLLDEWTETRSSEARSAINRAKRGVQREVIEAGCLHTMTISPPPAVGGLVMQNVNPFDMIFDKVYLRSLNPYVRDMINQTIGVLEDRKNNPQENLLDRNEAQMKFQIQQGYVFVAMPIGPANPFDDVLDADRKSVV